MRLVTHTRALKLCARMNREHEVLDFVDSLSGEDVLYDLGACEGRFALYAAVKAHECVAFEPESLNFKALTQNLELNGLRGDSRFLAVNAAVGEKSGWGTMLIGQPWAGGHHKKLKEAPGRVDLDFETEGEERVKVISLDEFVSRENVPQPTHLKVDVDGSEIPFLNGAREVMSSARLKGIIIELCEADSSFVEVTRELADYGFVETRRESVADGLFNITWSRH